MKYIGNIIIDLDFFKDDLYLESSSIYYNSNPRHDRKVFNLINKYCILIIIQRNNENYNRVDKYFETKIAVQKINDIESNIYNETMLQC